MVEGFDSLKNVIKVKKYSKIPMIISNLPVSFCCSMVKELHSNRLNAVSAIPVAIVMEDIIPKKVNFTSGIVFFSMDCIKKPVIIMSTCINLLKSACITARSIDLGIIQNTTEKAAIINIEIDH
ncbi:MAG: hypothetical protein KDC25_00810 [Saprospiraceae bacterium]|nr:hypothetical protein [Saprospiraceae bacterium]